MQSQLPLYPEQASNFAQPIDGLMIFITSVCVFFAAAITFAIIYFFFKYHRKKSDDIGVPIHGDSRLEALWLVVPAVLVQEHYTEGPVWRVELIRVKPTKMDTYRIRTSIR